MANSSRFEEELKTITITSFTIINLKITYSFSAQLFNFL